jgi:hypothetical protein
MVRECVRIVILAAGHCCWRVDGSTVGTRVAGPLRVGNWCARLQGFGCCNRASNCGKGGPSPNFQVGWKLLI